MKIDKQEVERIARLARLKLTDEEVAQYQAQLSGILDYVAQLDELKTGSVVPTAQVTGLSNKLADDMVGNKKQEKLPVDVPATDRTSIKVKGVFDG